MNAGPGTAAAPDPPFRRRLLRWALLCLPVVYLSHPLLTLIHEVLGHGLAARLHGGWFRGFYVYPLGGGFAVCDAPGFELQVVLAGWAADAVALLAFLLVAGRLPCGSSFRAALLLAAMLFSEFALAQAFHEGVYFNDVGDFTRAAALLEAGSAGLALAFGGATGFLATVYGFGRVLVRDADLGFGREIAARDGRRALVVTLLVLLPGGWWLAMAAGPLGWSRSIFTGPVWPYLAALGAHAIVAAILFLLPARSGDSRPASPPGWKSILAAWVVALTLFSCAWLWWMRGAWSA